MNKTLRDMLDVAWFLIVFVLIQWVVASAVVFAGLVGEGGAGVMSILQQMTDGHYNIDGNSLLLVSVISSVLTILLFGWRRWSPFSHSYVRSKPWLSMLWVALLALGTILPSEWILEQMELRMPESTGALFEDIMGKPVGYLFIGILAPVAEEMVFRGAILRKLLTMFSQKNHWIPIVISAVLFGALHMNWPQFVHAALIGLLLGWLYYRTGSIVPGIVFHWVNNTMAYVMFNLMPQMNDGKLIDFFHGDRTMMSAGLFFSLCIFLPSLFQLIQRLKRK